jgi:DNA-binding transcriptional ArsR family regulator
MSDATGPVRQLDAHSLRGLAHPLRIRILGILRMDGPSTATRLARRLGQDSGNISWHLRQLAEHGFIAEDAERGTRRERWWQAVHQANRLDVAGLEGGPETGELVTAYLGHILEQAARRRSWPTAAGRRTGGRRLTSPAGGWS